MEKVRVPLEDLQATVADKQAARLQDDWKTATDAYLASPAGRDWVGGEENMKLVGLVIQQQGWVDAEDKQGALEAAVQYLREKNLLVENPDTAYQRELQEVRSPEEITAINHKYFGSELFNR